jgi:sulfur dioxygenase
MDVAVPANMKVGLAQEEIARRGWALSAGEALARAARALSARADRLARCRASPTLPSTSPETQPHLPSSALSCSCRSTLGGH